MASTRKLDLDGLINSLVALAVVDLRRPPARPAPRRVATSCSTRCMIVCGLVIHYSMLVLTMSLAFWITSAQGIEGSYFTLSGIFPAAPRGVQGLLSA